MSRHDVAERLFGSNDLDRVFSAGQSKAIAPWPRAGHLKAVPASARTVSAEQLRSPVRLTEVDPRTLWSSQGWVVREHAEYYRTGEWDLTGQTSANRDVESNHWPIVMHDHLGRPVIRAGHHRSLAALVEGRPLLARVFGRDPDRSDAVAITPLLLVGVSTDLEHVVCTNVDDAVARMRSGQRVLCADARIARDAARLVSPDLASYRLPSLDGV